MGRARRRRKVLTMPTAVIVDAVRTPGGKRNGKLKNWHPVDLAAEALKAIAGRNNLDPALVDDVIMGCVMPGRRAGLQRRSQCGARRRLARVGARHDDRPPVRVVPAGAALRRPRRHGRRLRRRRSPPASRCMTRVPMGSSIGKDARLALRPQRDPRATSRSGA